LTQAAQRLELTTRQLSDNLSDMKTVSSREFQKNFGQLAEKLRAGQTVEVTKHGKTVGRFTKTNPQPKTMPNFLEKLNSLGSSKALGNRILKEFNDSLR
jgi:antitoxin (DNA-binding transcriptional repressor) of toxin-antitoxin stability system